MSQAFDAIRELVRQRLSPWCRCICREYPDGTLCKLCGHAHEPKSAAQPASLSDEEIARKSAKEIVDREFTDGSALNEAIVESAQQVILAAIREATAARDARIAELEQRISVLKRACDMVGGMAEGAESDLYDEKARADSALSRLDDVARTLREYEWNGWVLDCGTDPAVRRPYCTICRRDNTEGHAPDCWLAALLSRIAGE